MAPGAIGVDYRDQVISNGRMYLGHNADLHIITSFDLSDSSPWEAHLLQRDAGEATRVLSVTGNTIGEVFTKLHEASARAVRRHIKANGFGNPCSSLEDFPESNTKRKDGGKIKEKSRWRIKRADYLEVSSGSDEEDNLSDASASSRGNMTNSRIPVLTPLSSTESKTPSPPTIPQEGAAPLKKNPLMQPNMIANMKPLRVPPPEPFGYTFVPMHPVALPPPRMAMPQTSRAPSSTVIPPPVPYQNPFVEAVLTFRSNLYGELIVLDNCIMNQPFILKRARDILAEKFTDFSLAITMCPPKETIRNMHLQIESVTANGQKYVIGSGLADLSALPLGHAPRGVNIVISVDRRN